MNRERIAYLSLRREIDDLMKSSSVWRVPWNVYGETDLMGTTLSPTRPYVYLVEAGIRFAARNLPVIALEFLSEPVAFQLGSMSTLCIANVHIFGENTAQRSDIASAIMENILVVKIRNYDDDEYGGTVIQRSAVMPQGESRVQWTQYMMSPPSDDAAIEGSLSMWSMINCRFTYV